MARRSADEECPSFFIAGHTQNCLSFFDFKFHVGVHQDWVVFCNLHLIDFAMRGAKNEVFVIFILIISKMANAWWNKRGTLQWVNVVIWWELRLARKIPLGPILIIEFNVANVADRKVPLLVNVEVVDMATLLLRVPLNVLELYQLRLETFVLQVAQFVNRDHRLREGILDKSDISVWLGKVVSHVAWRAAAFQVHHAVETFLVHVWFKYYKL